MLRLLSTILLGLFAFAVASPLEDGTTALPSQQQPPASTAARIDSLPDALIQEEILQYLPPYHRHQYAQTCRRARHLVQEYTRAQILRSIPNTGWYRVLLNAVSERWLDGGCRRKDAVLFRWMLECADMTALAWSRLFVKLCREASPSFWKEGCAMMEGSGVEVSDKARRLATVPAYYAQEMARVTQSVSHRDRLRLALTSGQTDEEFLLLLDEPLLLPTPSPPLHGNRGVCTRWVTLLHLTISTGDPALVRSLLALGVDVNQHGCRNPSQTSLHYALRLAHHHQPPPKVEVVRALVEAGTMVMPSDLVHTLHAKRFSLALELLRGHSVDQPLDSHFQQTLLQLFSRRRGQSEVVRFLVEQGASVNLDLHGFGAPLLLAAQHGFLRTVEELMRQGARVDQPNASGETALSMAAAGGHLAVVQYLVREGGANRNHPSVLRNACENGHVEVVEWLLQHAVNVHQKYPKDGRSALEWAHYVLGISIPSSPCLSEHVTSYCIGRI